MRVSFLSSRKVRSGITMLELLFSIAILAMLAFLVGSSAPIATTSRFKAQQLNRATGLAQKELEAIMATGYANVTPTQLVAYGLLDNSTGNGAGLYTFTNVDLSVKDSPGNVLPQGQGTVLIEQLATDIRRITVTVTWSERGVVNRSVTYGSVIANI